MVTMRIGEVDGGFYHRQQSRLSNLDGECMEERVRAGQGTLVKWVRERHKEKSTGKKRVPFVIVIN